MQDLKQWVETEHTAKEWFVVIEAVRKAVEVFRELGVAHGDLHFGGIMFFGGKVKLIDFGEMRAIDEYPNNWDWEKFLSNFDGLEVPTEVQEWLAHQSRGF
jgi:serine/threonine-protein kinase RIO1